MKERNLVICDREIRYASILGENISMREELAVKVHVCSNLDKVRMLSEEKPIHILVVDEEYSHKKRNEIVANQVFVLCKEHVTDLGEEECQIGKYQCADDIIREIFEVYIDRTKENMMRCKRKDRARLVAVYSPIHRLGKTRFAMALGTTCASKKKVLYINLEEYSGMAEAEGLCLGDMLYYIKQGNGNLEIRLQATIKKMGEMDCIKPLLISQDLKEVSQTEWEELLDHVLQHSIYELVILDVSESVQGLWSILQLCDRVYMPILEDDISRRKLQQYERTIEQLNLEKLERITYRFVMPEQIEEYAKARAKEEMQ